MELLFYKPDKNLKAKGQLFFTDFKVQIGKGFWQKAMLKTVYIFLKINCNIDASTLKDTRA